MHFGNYWKHKKGGYYDRFPENASHSEDLTPYVIYRSIKANPADEAVWVRPASMWDEIDDNGVARFTPVTDDDFITVTYHKLVCIECGEEQSLGKFHKGHDAIVSLREQGHSKCQLCDKWVNPEYRYTWVEKVEIRLLYPLAHRLLAEVK